MPWKETGPVLERMRFIEDYLSGFYSITELAARYGMTPRRSLPADEIDQRLRDTYAVDPLAI